MESNLKVFQTLNCSVCKSPYSRSGSGPKSPLLLWCGEVVCKACWEKESPLSWEKRQHQCEWKPNCYFYERPALFLLEILNNASIIESPNGNGYLLSKSLKVPECPVCHEEYSMEVEDTKLFVLSCGHLICHGCLMAIQTDSGNERGLQAKCPQCRVSFYTPKNPFQEFLQELPEMTKQMELNERKQGEEKECPRELIAKYRKIFGQLDEELMKKMADFEERIFELNSPKEPNINKEKESMEISENE